MRDLIKKTEDDLLVVHKANAAGDRALAPEMAALPFDVQRLAAQLRASGDAGERARLLAAIQGRFGNAFAGRVVEAARGPSGPSEGGTGGGQGEGHP